MKNKILLSISFILFCYFNSFSQKGRDFILKLDSISESAVGREFHDFKFVSITGDTTSVNDLLGKITIVNFWFENCPPCIVELEYLKKLYNKYKDNPNFLFLSFTIDDLEIARKAVIKYNIPYIVFPISREDANEMNFRMGFPTNIILNRERKIIFFKSGGSLDKIRAEELILEIDKIVAKNITNK